MTDHFLTVDRAAELWDAHIFLQAVIGLRHQPTTTGVIDK